ncbi:hypothetical protein BaRGS_00000816 [Batillaria attramentaria]|uniref:Membrane protein BRI3 n=1 Tax=Batillaria attramentaria TaxID=370345 RepID=A0ABD0M8U0_9CAEN
MAEHPPAYQDAVKQPAGVYQPQQGYGAVPGQAGYPPQGGYNQPQGGYPPAGAPPAGAVPTYQYNVTMQPTQRVVVVGGCPACRVGVLEDDFTCLGVLCAILFFPIGILCCLAMRQRRCAHCGATFG